MALIKCLECGKEISDKAPTCPHCGIPTVLQKESRKDKNSMDNLDLAIKAAKIRGDITNTGIVDKSKCIENYEWITLRDSAEKNLSKISISRVAELRDQGAKLTDEEQKGLLERDTLTLQQMPKPPASKYTGYENLPTSLNEKRIKEVKKIIFKNGKFIFVIVAITTLFSAYSIHCSGSASLSKFGYGAFAPDPFLGVISCPDR